MLTSTRLPWLSTVELLVRYAIKAPSAHNSQPWRFEVCGPSSVRVYADRSRQLPIGDADGRELVMSCGAAIENFVVAARAFGFDTSIAPLPDVGEPDCLAAMTLSPGEWPTDEESLLFDAIDMRRTARGALRGLPIDPTIVSALAASAAARNATFVTMNAPETRVRLGALIEAGDRRLFAHAPWRSELASWIRRPRGGDGISIGRAPAPLARVAVRTLDLGPRVARSDSALAQEAPLLAVIATAADSLVDWLAAGRALERVLLTAARYGLQAGFLNQPCQVADLRLQLQALILDLGHPQVVLRIGRPAEAARFAPRRDLSDVLVPATCWPLAAQRSRVRWCLAPGFDNLGFPSEAPEQAESGFGLTAVAISSAIRRKDGNCRSVDGARHHPTVRLLTPRRLPQRASSVAPRPADRRR
jgi:nitroreductase